MMKINGLISCEDAKLFKETDDSLIFSKIFRTLYPHVYAHARYILKNHEDAEEATQDAFIKLTNSILKWNPDLGKFTAWFAIVARRSIIDSYRKQQRYLKRKGTVPSG